jgi:hypothetical protein
LNGGADQALFNVDPATGVVTFNAAPDFEAPADNDGDNVYEIEVTVSDGSLEAAQSIAITVTDVAEIPPLAADLDGNGVADALTDGILVVRLLFGVTGPALSAGAVAADATRSTPEAIADYFDTVRDPFFDIDLDGSASALTDGILLVRRLFGVSGPSLTEGAVSPDGERVESEPVADYIDLLTTETPAQPVAPSATPKTDGSEFEAVLGSPSDLGTSPVTNASAFTATPSNNVANSDVAVAIGAYFDAKTNLQAEGSDQARWLHKGLEHQDAWESDFPSC